MSDSPTLRAPVPGDHDTLISLARRGEPGIRRNNAMVYHLACTVFAASTRIAFVDDEPAGYVLAMPHADRTALWVHQLVVAPEWRGQGLGRRLMDAARRIAADCALPEIRLLMHPSNPARFLYEGMGYRPWPKGDGVGLLCYRYRLP